jgi:hypothetical protein
MLLRNFNANVGREDIFKGTFGNKSLHEVSNDNGVRVVSFDTLEIIIVKNTVFPHCNIHKVRLKYLGMTVTSQNCIQEEIRSILYLATACNHSVLNLLPSHILYKNLYIKMYRIIMSRMVLYGSGTWYSYKGKSAF